METEDNGKWHGVLWGCTPWVHMCTKTIVLFQWVFSFRFMCFFLFRVLCSHTVQSEWFPFLNENSFCALRFTFFFAFSPLVMQKDLAFSSFLSCFEFTAFHCTAKFGRGAHNENGVRIKHVSLRENKYNSPLRFFGRFSVLLHAFFCRVRFLNDEAIERNTFFFLSLRR